MALLSCARTAFVDEVEEASVTRVPSIGAESDGAGPSLSLVILVITYYPNISRDCEYVCNTYVGDTPHAVRSWYRRSMS